MPPHSRKIPKILWSTANRDHDLRHFLRRFCFVSTATHIYTSPAYCSRFAWAKQFRESKHDDATRPTGPAFTKYSSFLLPNCPSAISHPWTSCFRLSVIGIGQVSQLWFPGCCFRRCTRWGFTGLSDKCRPLRSFTNLFRAGKDPMRAKQKVAAQFGNSAELDLCDLARKAERKQGRL